MALMGTKLPVPWNPFGSILPLYWTQEEPLTLKCFREIFLPIGDAVESEIWYYVSCIAQDSFCFSHLSYFSHHLYPLLPIQVPVNNLLNLTTIPALLLAQSQKESIYP